MIIIRSDQYELFNRDAEQRFIRDVIAHLRERYPTTIQGLAEDELFARVRCGFSRASKRYALGKRIDLLTFVLLMFKIAPNFDFHPSINALLTHPGIPPDARMDFLIEHVSEEDWEQAREAADEAAWRIGF